MNPRSRAFSIQVGAHTDVGHVRERNEDAKAVLDLGSKQSARRLLLVCDGLGGAAGGDVASRLAAETITSWVDEKAHQVNDVTSAANCLRDATFQANRRIYEQAQQKRALRGMGTTVSAALVGFQAKPHARAWLVVAQVGDSRVYLLRRDRLVQLTQDQSMLTALVNLGVVSFKQATGLSGLNLLLQAVGTEEQVKVVLHHVTLLRGDVVLLCTDGLTAVLSDRQIEQALNERKSCTALARKLVEKACAAGGPDNVTVIVAKAAGSLLELPSTDEVVAEPVYGTTT